MAHAHGEQSCISHAKFGGCPETGKTFGFGPTEDIELLSLLGFEALLMSGYTGEFPHIQHIGVTQKLYDFLLAKEAYANKVPWSYKTADMSNAEFKSIMEAYNGKSGQLKGSAALVPYGLTVADILPVTTNKTSDLAYPYRDVGGIWTIGMGSTKDMDTGRSIQKNHPPIDWETAEEWKKRQVEQEFLPEIVKRIGVDVCYMLNQDQLNAIVSMCYNAGVNNILSIKGTVPGANLKLLRNFEFDKFGAKIPTIAATVGGVLNTGLQKRRREEHLMFFSKLYSSIVLDVT